MRDIAFPLCIRGRDTELNFIYHKYLDDDFLHPI